MKKAQQIAINQPHAIASAKTPLPFDPPVPWREGQKAQFDRLIISRNRMFWNHQRLMAAWQLTDTYFHLEHHAKWLQENADNIDSPGYSRVQRQYCALFAAQRTMLMVLGMTARGMESQSQMRGRDERELEANVLHLENNDGDDGYL